MGRVFQTDDDLNRWIEARHADRKPPGAPAPVQTESETVPIFGRVTGDRDHVLYHRRVDDDALTRAIRGPLDDCSREIEFCFRYRAGSLRPTARVATYEPVTGKAAPQTSKKAEDLAIMLLPIYDEWMRRCPPMLAQIVRLVFLEAMSTQQVQSRYGLPDRATVIEAVRRGLNSYAVLRGKGDCLSGRPSVERYVYVIASPEFPTSHCIGVSRNPARRLLDLTKETGHQLVIVYLSQPPSGILKTAHVRSQFQSHVSSLKGWYNAPLEIIKAKLRQLYPDAEEIILDGALKTDL